MYVLKQNIFFIIVDIDGSCLSMCDDNKPYFTTDYNAAYLWKKKKKAENYLSFNLNYNPNYCIKQIEKIEDIKTNTIVNKHFLDNISFSDNVPDNKKNICYTDVDEWINLLSSEKNGLNADRAMTICCQASKELSQLDRTIVDIYHYIEFGNFNAYQGWKLFKLLQTILRQRRNAKDILYVFHDNCGNTLSKSSKILSRANELKGRGYTPRLLKSMFIK